MGDAYSSSNPYKRKRRSFEKKHNAILDVVKRNRRDSLSPTSVVHSSGANSPATTTTATTTPSSASSSSSSSPSPEPRMPGVASAASLSAAAVTASNSMLKRPGQIGFARGSMLQFGLGATPPLHHHNLSHHQASSSPYAQHPLHYSIGSSTSSLHQQQMAAAAAVAQHRRHQHHLSMSTAAAPLPAGVLPSSYHSFYASGVNALPSRRVSMPLYASYPPPTHHHTGPFPPATPMLVSRRASAPETSTGAPTIGAPIAAPRAV